MKYRWIFLLILLISIPAVSSQDTSKIGVEENNQWEFELVQYEGDEEFRISSGSDGVMSEGDTYTFTITSEISDSGTYDFEYENDDTAAAGVGDLGEFSVDPRAIYTDWEYWEENAEDSDTLGDFKDLGISFTVDNGDDVFKISAEDTDLSFKIEVEYYKSTGVLKRTYLSMDSAGILMGIENVTGSEADDAPGFALISTILSLSVFVLAISKLRKRRNR